MSFCLKYVQCIVTCHLGDIWEADIRDLADFPLKLAIIILKVNIYIIFTSYFTSWSI